MPLSAGCGSGEDLLAKLMNESILFRRPDRREVTLHAEVSQLLGRGPGSFPADLAGEDDLIVTAVEETLPGGGGV